ncbi:MAG: ABC transporter ATP-binding protein, partial [Microlunatus sp.]|nr:ABC transporter ATP-binding protein [Microlunatus sp.]
LVSQGSLAALQADAAVNVRLETTEGETSARVLTGLGLTVSETVRTDNRTVLTARLGQVELTQIVPALVAAEATVLAFNVVSASLEDVFVSLTGEGFEVSG